MGFSDFDDLAPPSSEISASSSRRGRGGGSGVRSSSQGGPTTWEIAKGVCLGMLMYSVIATILGSLVLGLIVPGCVKRSMSDEFESLDRLLDDVNQLTSSLDCMTCNGLGIVTCTTCGGTGQTRGYGGAASVCTQCGGMGRVPCPDCRGPGPVR